MLTTQQWIRFSRARSVPKSYGDALKYFKPPEQAKMDAFVKRELPFVQLAPAHGQGHFDCDTD
jgi:hypothetical protein